MQAFFVNVSRLCETQPFFMKKDEIFEKDGILDLNFFQNLILIYVGIRRICMKHENLIRFENHSRFG
jgi:hypothetical protein